MRRDVPRAGYARQTLGFSSLSSAGARSPHAGHVSNERLRERRDRARQDCFPEGRSRVRHWLLGEMKQSREPNTDNLVGAMPAD